jgi:hypothetical protein
MSNGVAGVRAMWNAWAGQSSTIQIPSLVLKERGGLADVRSVNNYGYNLKYHQRFVLVQRLVRALVPTYCSKTRSRGLPDR